MSAWSALAVTLAGAALGAGGCGGGGNTQSPALVRAQAICAQARKQAIEAHGPRQALDAIVAKLRSTIPRLAAIQPPASDARAYRAYVTGLERALEGFERADSAIRAGQRAEAERLLASTTALSNSLDASARAAGLAACA